MLTIFRTNQEPVGILYLPFIALFLGIHWWYPLPVVALPALGPLGMSMLPTEAFWPDWMVLLTALVLLIQGFLVNQLVITHRLNRDINLFPGLFVIILSVALPVFTHQLPLILSNLVLLLSVSASFDIYKRPDAAGRIFNIGLFIGFAGLIYLPAFFFLLFGIIALGVMRSTSWRERMTLISGTGVAVFLTATVYQYVGQFGAFSSALQNGFALFNWRLPPATNDWVLLGFLGALLLLLLGSYGNYQSKKSIQSQKKISLLYYLLICVGLSIFFTAGLEKAHLLLLTLPVGILLSFTFTELSRGLADVLFVMLLLGFCWLHFGTFVTG